MQRSRHIALFLRYLPIGGIQRIFVRLANEFVARGHQVELIVAKGKGALASELDERVKLVDLGHQRVWTVLPALAKHLRESNPDVLLSAEAPANLVAIWAKILLLGRLRVVISVRSNMTQYARGGETWYAGIIPFLINACYPFADRVITVSRGVLENLAEISPKAASKGVVIYNPVVDESLKSKMSEPLEDPWFVGSDVPIIISVGRLTLQKNYDLLLRAFARLRKEREARLVIIGDGNQRAQLEAEVTRLGLQECVLLPGFKPNPYPYMSRAALFVMSSDYEGFGSVLVEAMACGCPIVSTDCPSGPREILEDGRWGDLVPVRDEEALAHAMERALTRKHDRNALRARASDFSVATGVERYLNVLFPGADHRSNLNTE